MFNSQLFQNLLDQKASLRLLVGQLCGFMQGSKSGLEPGLQVSCA